MLGKTAIKDVSINSVHGGRRCRTRSKYTQQACNECRARKIKCCGNLPCSRCASHQVVCSYSSAATKMQNRDGSLGEERLIKGNRIPENERPCTTIGAPSRKRRYTSDSKCSAPSMVEKIETIGGVISIFDNQTDTFELEDTLECRRKQPLSLQSKMSAIRDTLCLQPLKSPSLGLPESCPAIASAETTIKLPPPVEMHRLLQVFFREFNPYFPCLHQESFESQLLLILSSQDYSENRQTVKVNALNVYSLDLLCTVLALAVFVDPEELSADKASYQANYPRGWNWHIKARQLRQLFRSPTVQNIDIVRYRLLESMYLVHVERLGESCEAIALSIVAAQAVGLNDQSTWSDLSALEVLNRRVLWWIIYYQDRRIAEKLGRPYIIRDTEIDVDDFSSVTDSRSENSVTWQERVLLYMQSLVNWGRTWAKIWDAFFSPSARSLGDQDATDDMDKVVLDLQSKLPHCLSYDQNLLNPKPNDVATESENFTRYRILCHTRINLLRLTIRHNPLLSGQDDIQTASMCAIIARSTIRSLCAYQTTYQHVHQLGLFVTASIVECIYHLISARMTDPNLRVQKNNKQEDSDELIAAKDLLKQMSPRFAAATRAQRIVDPLLSAMADLSKGDTLPILEYDTIFQAQDTMDCLGNDELSAEIFSKFLSYDIAIAETPDIGVEDYMHVARLVSDSQMLNVTRM